MKVGFGVCLMHGNILGLSPIITFPKYGDEFIYTLQMP